MIALICICVPGWGGRVGGSFCWFVCFVFIFILKQIFWASVYLLSHYIPIVPIVAMSVIVEILTQIAPKHPDLAYFKAADG